MKYEAHIFDDPSMMARSTVRLAIASAHNTFLMRDGSWSEQIEPGMTLEGVGIELPREAIEAVAEAIERWQGHTNHGDTEARVLREWLDSERKRVDRVLDDIVASMKGE